MNGIERFRFRFNMILIICICTSVLGCSRNEDKATEPSRPDLTSEKLAITNTYYFWSQYLIAQDYAKAISLTIPGSNAFNSVNVAKDRWDQGWQFYDDITYVEAWLTESNLFKNYGEAVGNLTFYQYHTSSGALEYNLGFYSTCRKVNGTWLIDGLNSNLEVDWWR